MDRETKALAPHAQDRLYRGLVEHAADAIIFADCDGLIRLWNLAAEAVFGHAAQDVVGESLDIIIPERFRRAHWDGYHRALAAGHALHGRRALPTRATRKDGSRLYVHLSFSVVKDPQGRVIGAMAIARDITARYLEEKEQRARLAERQASSSSRKSTCARPEREYMRLFAGVFPSPCGESDC